MSNAAKILDYEPTHFIDKEHRVKLTKIIMNLLDEWGLSTAQQLRLLGLRETSRNMLIRYRNNQSVMPYEQDKLDRMGIMLAIYKNLYDLYPENENIRKLWIHKKNKNFDGQKPIAVMLSGIFGMADVMRYLDLQMVI